MLANAALCAFAEKLTLDTARMSATDIEVLRAADFDERAIHDATLIAGYFNAINQVGEALGVDQESFFGAWKPPPGA